MTPRSRGFVRIELQSSAVDRLRRNLPVICEAGAVHDRGGQIPRLWGAVVQADAVRAGVAAFLGCTLDEITLTHNTTDGMNLVAEGCDLREGDHIPPNHAGAVVIERLLTRHNVCVRSVGRPAIDIRISPHVYNSPEDVDRLAEAMRTELQL